MSISSRWPGQPWLLAARALRRRPAYALTSILVLAAGIGAAATLFSILDTVLLQPLPFPHANRLVLVLEANPAKRQNASLISPANLADWNRKTQAFTAIAGEYAENDTDTSGAEPLRIQAIRVSPGYFHVMGMAPLLGRWFTQAEEGPAPAPGAAVISYAFWSRRYHRSPNLLDHALILAGVRYPIVGVMPKDFTSSPVDAWLPAQLPPFLQRLRDARFYTGIGRLRPGVTRAQGQADLDRVQAQLGAKYPATDGGWSAQVGSLKEFLVGSSRATLWAIFAGVMLLLALAIANIAGLTLAQLQSRSRELAIRSALGGSRVQVAATILREALLLSLAAAALGGGLAWAGVRAAAHLAPGTIPRMAELMFDPRGWAFAVALSAIAAVAFGLGPAWAATQPRLAQLLASLNAGAPGGRRRLQRALVIAQLALTVLLAAGAGLLLRSFYNLSHVDGGFDAANAFTFHIGAAWNEDRGKIGALQVALIHALRAQPGVVAAGFTNFLPASNATLQFQIQLAGMAGGEGGTYSVGERTVTAGYLQALRVPLLAGRWCRPLRNSGLNGAAEGLVNAAFVRTYMHGESVVGRAFHMANEPGAGASRIVGVVGDVRENSLAEAATPFLYLCLPAGSWPDPNYLVRTAGDPGATMAGLRPLVDRIAPGRAVFGLQRLSTRLGASLAQPQLEARFLSLFAAFGLILAALGLYSLISLLVAAERRELGVRLALGATPRHIAAVVLASTARLLAWGAAAGLALVWAADRLLASLLYGVRPLDPLNLAAAVAAMALVAGVAAWLPAHRAANLDPLTALRVE
jgi:putative ABC transport system permease protein